MPFLHILLSKIKLHHVSELGVTCWVCCVCVGGCLKLSIVLKQCASVIVRKRRGLLVNPGKAEIMNLYLKLEVDVCPYVRQKMSSYGGPLGVRWVLGVWWENRILS